MFCTYLTIYSGNKLPPFYIGYVRTERILNKNYHGTVSSKQYSSIFKIEELNNPHLFKTIILKHHDTKEEAICKEVSLLTKIDARNNPMYINMTNGHKKYRNVKGKIFSETHKNNLSKSHIGNKHSDETKSKMSLSQKTRIRKPPSEETKLKISLKLKGRRLTEEHKINLRGPRKL